MKKGSRVNASSTNRKGSPPNRYLMMPQIHGAGQVVITWGVVSFPLRLGPIHDEAASLKFSNIYRQSRFPTAPEACLGE